MDVYGNKNRIVHRFDPYCYNHPKAQVLTACRNAFDELTTIKVQGYEDRGGGFVKIGDPLWFGGEGIRLLVDATKQFTTRRRSAKCRSKK